MKIDVMGVRFDNVTMDEALAQAKKILAGDQAAYVVTPNAEIVQLCIEKNEYYPLINSADLIIPDGAGVILASKMLKRPLKKGKVAGIELCERLIALAAELEETVKFTV